MNYTYDIDIKDTFYGVVKYQKKSGIYILLPNSNELCFSFSVMNILPGTKVLCSMKKTKTETGKLPLVYIESVIYEDRLIA